MTSIKILLLVAATMKTANAGSMRGSSKCSYSCPTHASRLPNRECYNNFDDCECNFGYMKQHGRCVSKCRNDYYCPANSHRIPGRKCYNNFGDCECEHGYKKQNGKCIKQPTYKVCPHDFENKDGVCIKTTHKVCPNGFDYKWGECVKTARKICPHGFDYSEHDHKCLLTQHKFAKKVCPQGFEHKHDECVKMAEKVCPHSFKYKGGQCVKVASKVCPSGYEHKHGDCMKTAHKECPHGYTYDGYYGKCSKSEKVFAEKVCPAGYQTHYWYSSTGYRQDNCIKTAHKVCPSGFVYSGDRCVKVDSNDEDQGWKLAKVTDLGVYPGFKGKPIIGKVDLLFKGKDVVVKFDLLHVDGGCKQPSSAPNSCGIHIHAGTSCQDAPKVGGHYFNKNFIKVDPWATATYGGKSVVDNFFRADHAEGTTRTIGDGFTYDQTIGHALVIHDRSGARVTCAIIKP